MEKSGERGLSCGLVRGARARCPTIVQDYGDVERRCVFLLVMASKISGACGPVEREVVAKVRVTWVAAAMSPTDLPERSLRSASCLREVRRVFWPPARCA